MENPYQVLLIPEDSPPAIVNYAYRVLSRRWHPDTHPDNKEEAEKRMKEINNAYDEIKKANIGDTRWDFFDYTFKGPSPNDELFGLHDTISKIFGYGSTAQLDCWSAEIHRVLRRSSRKFNPSVAEEAIAASISKYRRSDFLLTADPEDGYRTDIEIELEDLLIAVSRKKGEKVHPIYVRPTIKYYGVENQIEARINEFCEMVSAPKINPAQIIHSFELGKVLPEDDRINYSKQTLLRFGWQLDCWQDPGFIVEETKDGGLKLSYYIDEPLMMSKREKIREKAEFELTKKDYTFIQYLVFGGKLLEASG